MLRVALLLGLVCQAGCYGFADPGPTRLLPAAEQMGIVLGELPIDAPPGLSDITLGEMPHAGAGEDKVLWALPERRGKLYQLRSVGMPSDNGPLGLLGPRPGAAMGRALELTASLPISNLRTDVDLEAVAALGPHLVAIGTESLRARRKEDLILLVENDARQAKVTRTIPFPYRLWGVEAAANEGIEAMCAAAGALVAASESVVTTPDGTRLAPLGITHLPHESFAPYFVELSHNAGRLSAMTCRSNARGDSIEVLAIERHYGVGRLISFSVPHKDVRAKMDGKPATKTAPAPAPQPPRIKTRVLVDLGTWVHPLPNFEGIVQLPYGDYLLLSDNDTGGAARPAQVLLIPERVINSLSK